MQIDYYYIGISPFSYLGHQAIQDVAARHGATLNIKPFNLFGVWEVSGAVPPAQRPPVRQRYRFLELQRSAEMRGVPITLKPAHFPADVTLADSVTIAMIEKGMDPLSYMDNVYRAVWVNDKDIADENVVSECITSSGARIDDLIDLAKSDAIAAIRAQNTQDAIDADAIGAPAYVVDGEVFWGQDRIEYVDRMLETGRAAYSSEV